MLTVQELIDRLECFRADDKVALAVDAEGNGFRPLFEVTKHGVNPSEWEGGMVQEQHEFMSVVVLWPT